MGFSLKKAFSGSMFDVGFGLFGGGGDPGKKQYGQMMSVYQKAQSNQALQFARAQGEQKKALGAIKTGFGAARANTGQVFRQARVGAQELGQQGLAASQQGMVDRGLYNTTVFDNAQRGVNADITRSLAEIDAAYAQGIAGLDVGEGQAVAGVHQGMAGLYQNQSAQSTALSGDIAQAIANVQYEDPNAWLKQLLGIGGMAAGFAIGGPPGAMMGKQLVGGNSPFPGLS